MAIVPLSRKTPRPLPGVEVVTWVLANTDTGQPWEIANYSDKTFQIFGTFGSGGSVTMQGSNDPRVITDADNAVWFTLVDPQANAITKTSAGGETILENPLYIRPQCTAGDGTTALTVIVCARKA
jgi:hypothetical protein